MANERMTFTLVGRDNLSREFNRAGASAAELQRDIERASAQSRASLAGLQRDAQGRLRDVRGRFVSTAQAAAMMGDAVDDSLGRVSSAANRASSSLGKLSSAVKLAGLAAIVPVAAAGASALVSLAAAAGAATAGVAAFGLAVAPQIKKITAASEAQTKLTEAVGKHGPASDEALEAQTALNGAIADANRSTTLAVHGFLNLRKAYEDWANSLADDTMPVLTHSFVTLGEVLPRLSPLVRGTATELDRLMAVAAGGVSGGAFDKFIENVTELSSGTLHRVTTELANLSRTMDSLDTSMLDRFMSLADEHGADAAEALGNVAEALGNILLAAGEAGVGVLAVANALAELVNAIPPDLLATAVQLYAAFKLYGLAAAGVAALGRAFAATSTQLTVMRARAAAAGSAMAGLRAQMAAMGASNIIGLAIAGTIAAAYAINELAENARGAPPDVDKLTTSLKELAVSGKVVGELDKTFGDLDGVGKALNRVTADTAAWNAVNETLGSTVGNTFRKVYDLADSFIRGSESAKASREDFTGLDKSLADLVQSGHADVAAAAFGRIASQLKSEGKSAKEVKAILPEYSAALKAAKVANELAAEGMGLFGQKALETTRKLADQKATADGLRKAYFELNNAALIARGGIRGMEAAIDEATAAVKENGATLDVNTEKGRANQAALDQIASSTMEAATAARENGASWARVSGVLDRGRAALVKTAQQMGLTSAEANKLADRILKIPDKTVMFRGEKKDLDQKIEAAQRHVDSLKQQRATTLEGDRGPIDAAVRRAQDRVDSLKQKRAALLKAQDATGPGVSSARANVNSLRDKTITITSVFRSVYYTAKNPKDLAAAHGRSQGGPIRGYASGGQVAGFPGGGYVAGAGTSTSDSIPAMLSDGEYVIRAAMVKRYGESFFAMLNQGSLPLDRPTAGSSGLFERGGRNVGREVADGLRDALPDVRDAARRLGQELAGQTKRSGYDRAVSELNRLVESGRWRKNKSWLFEDVSFRGMSSNYEKHQRKVSDGFWSAVREIKRAVDSGRRVHEDMTFKGMSQNVLRFHDAIAKIWKGNPYFRGFGDWGNFGKYRQYGKYASGGLVTGPGTGTSDSLPAMLSNGEYVVRAAAVQRYGAGMLDAVNQMRAPARPTNVRALQPAAPAPSTTTYNVYPQRADFSVHDLEALQRRADARARIGRPR